MPDAPAIPRDACIDNLKAVAIVFVVFGHTIEAAGLLNTPSGLAAYALVYCWHMPLLIFVAGYLTREHPDHLKTASTLLVPYVIAETLFGLTDAVLFGEPFAVSLDKPNWGLWFLLALAVWRLYCPYVLAFRFALPLAVAAALAVGHWDFFGRDGSLSRIIVFMPFFLLGCYARRWDVLKRSADPARPYLPLAAIFALAGYATFVFIADGPHPYRWLYMSYGYAELGHHELWAFLYRAAFMAGALGWIVALLALVPTRTVWLSRLGAHTFSIYLFHLLALDVAKAAGMGEWGQAVSDGHTAMIWIAVPVLAASMAVLTGNPVAFRLSQWVFAPHLAVSAMRRGPVRPMA